MTQFSGKDARDLVRSILNGHNDQELMALGLPQSDNADVAGLMVYLLKKMKHPTSTGELVQSTTVIIDAVVEFAADLDENQGLLSVAAFFLIDEEMTDKLLDEIVSYDVGDDQFNTLVKLAMELDLEDDILERISELGADEPDYEVLVALAKKLDLEVPERCDKCDQDNEDCTCEQEEGGSEGREEPEE